MSGLGIHEAICQIKMLLSKHGGITKDRDSPMGYKYRGIEDFDEVLCGMTGEYGVVTYPRVVSKEIVHGQTAKGGPQIHAFLTVDWTFVCAKDGSREVVTTIGESLDTSDKACNKALQASRKYALLTVLQIPISGDDTEAHVAEVSAPVTRPEPKPGPAKAKKREPKADPTEDWKDTPTTGVQIIVEEGASERAEKMFERIGTVNTFPLLHAFAVDASTLPKGPSYDEVYRAIRDRAIALFAGCENSAEVKEGLALWKALGSPEDVGHAGNEAYARFRAPNGGQ